MEKTFLLFKSGISSFLLTVFKTLQSFLTLFNEKRLSSSQITTGNRLKFKI